MSSKCRMYVAAQFLPSPDDMASKIIDCLHRGKYDEARAYITRERNKLVTLTDIGKDKHRNNTYMIAQILKAKKGSWRRVVKSADGAKAQKAQAPYDRLFMLRDATDGTIFHVKTADVSETLIYLMPSAVQWLGEYVLIHEPYNVPDKMFDLPVVDSNSPFIPVNTNIMSPLAPYVKELARTAAFHSVFGAAADLLLLDVDMVYTCPMQACDGSHGYEKHCFGVEGTSGAAEGALSCRVTSETLKLENVLFKSRSFGAHFVATAYLGARPATVVDIDDLRDSVETTLAAYKAASIKWIISAWYKSPTRTGTDAAKGSRFHITSIRPERVLPVQLLTPLEVARP